MSVSAWGECDSVALGISSSHVTVVAQRSELDVDGKLDIGFYWIQCLE